MNNEKENEVWWDEQTAADYLKISLNHLHHLRQEKKLAHELKNKSPICHRKVRRYSKEVLDNYLERQKVVDCVKKVFQEKEAEVERLKPQTRKKVREGEIEYRKNLKVYTLQQEEARRACKKAKAQLTAEWHLKRDEIKKPLRRAMLELSRLRTDLRNLKK